MSATPNEPKADIRLRTVTHSSGTWKVYLRDSDVPEMQVATLTASLADGNDRQLGVFALLALRRVMTEYYLRSIGDAPSQFDSEGSGPEVEPKANVKLSASLADNEIPGSANGKYQVRLGTDLLKLPKPDAQKAGFWCPDANILVECLPNFWKLITDKG